MENIYLSRANNTVVVIVKVGGGCSNSPTYLRPAKWVIAENVLLGISRE